MTLIEFINKYLGTKVDFDGYYGAQCVDLFRQYCKDVLKIDRTPSVSGAKDIIDNPGKDLKVIKESTEANYSRGDVLVWNSSNNNKYGHVAILIDLLTTNDLLVLEQDGFKQDGVKINLKDRKNLLGALRLISEV